MVTSQVYGKARDHRAEEIGHGARQREVGVIPGARFLLAEQSDQGLQRHRAEGRGRAAEYTGNDYHGHAGYERRQQHADCANGDAEQHDPARTEAIRKPPAHPRKQNRYQAERRRQQSDDDGFRAKIDRVQGEQRARRVHVGHGENMQRDNVCDRHGNFLAGLSVPGCAGQGTHGLVRVADF